MSKLNAKEKYSIEDILTDKVVEKHFLIWYSRKTHFEIWDAYFDRENKYVIQHAPSYVVKYHVVRLKELLEFINETKNERRTEERFN